MSVTLREIAKATGYSSESVSGVLGTRAHLFSPDTRQKIAAAARRMGYRPNRAARATRSGRFMTVGVLHATDVAHNPIPASLLTALTLQLQKRGYQLAFATCDSRSLDDENAGPALLRETMCDGLLVHYPFEATPTLEAVLSRGGAAPVVWLNVRRDHDCVRPDDEAAGRASARCLLDAGHRRLAYVCTSYGLDQRHYSADQRRRGFQAEVHAAGIEPLVVDGVHEPPEQGMLAAGRLLDEADPRPTAVACYGGEAVGLLHAAERRGLRVPDDLSIVTFGPWSSRYLDAFFTGPRHDDAAAARAAVELLVTKIEESSAASRAPCVRVPMPMHIGGSVAPPLTP